MKNKAFAIIVLCVAIAPAALPASNNPNGTNAQRRVIQLSVSDVDNPPLTAQPTSPGVTPNGQKETPQDYSAAMIAITQRFSATLVAIADAVKHGELSSEQGRELSAELYQVAQMQFQLLSLWREIEQDDLVRIPDAQESAPLTQENEIVMVALPFSSFRLNSSLADYLGLTPSQVEAIQQVMLRQRHNLQPLMTQLRTTKEKLLAMGSDHMNEKEVKSLAEAQAALLAKLIVDNARMRSKIYKVLSPDQQKKLNDVERTQGSATVTTK
jgi:Spy/CpxP family protein refolding chaperone